MSWIIVDGYSQNTMRSGCLICANGEVRRTSAGIEPILSSGYEDSFVGTPEFCATCIGEAAEMLGFVSGHAHAKEVATRKAAQKEVSDLSAQLSDKAATIRTLTTELASSIEAAKSKPVSARSKASAA